MNIIPVICSDISSEKKDQIKNIFQELRFVKSMENFKRVENWLSKCKFNLGPFINGFWLRHFTRKCKLRYEKLPSINVGICSPSAASNVADAAHRAYIDQWKTLSSPTRAKYFCSIAKAIEENREVINFLDCLCSRKVVGNLKPKHTENLIDSFKYFASMVELWDCGLPKPKPPGIVAIVPNPTESSLASISQHVCSALALGNCVILFPNVSTCLPALFLAEMCHLSGLPDGVFNVVPFESDDDCFAILYNLCEWKIRNEDPDLDIQIVSSYEYNLFWEKLKNPEVSSTILNVQQDLHNSFPPTVITLDGADLHAVVAGILGILSAKCGLGEALFNVLVQDVHREDLLALLQSELNNETVVSSSETIISAASPNVEQPVLNNNVISWQNCKLSVCGFRTVEEVIKLFNSDNLCRTVCIWTEKTSTALYVANALKCDTVWLNCQDPFDPAIAYENSYTNIEFEDQDGFIKVSGSLNLDKYPTKSDDENSGQIRCKSAEVSFSQCQSKLFYNGSFKSPAQNEFFEVLDPNGKNIGRLPKGSAKDIGSAISSARAAYANWAAVSCFSRSAFLYHIAKILKKRRKDFISILQQHITETSTEESEQEVDQSIERLLKWSMYHTTYGAMVKDASTKLKVLQSKEPVGVIAIICPDIYPLFAFVSLLSAAIAHGNTVVLVPSEMYPVPALEMCNVFVEAGVPPGVINVIPGDVNILTRHLALHSQLDSIWLHNYTDLRHALVEKVAVKINRKRLWAKKWSLSCQGYGSEYIRQSTCRKTIWLPMEKIY